MNFTNKTNLPQYLEDWLVNDDYDFNNDPNVISTTTLMRPTKVHLLTSRHREEIEMDVVDLIASRMGNAIHDSIERIKTDNVSKEQRVMRSFSTDKYTYIITGKYDILEDHDGLFVLRDIKTTSVWAYIYGGKDEEYRKQLSIYKWLLSTAKNMADHAYIDFVFTDWQAAKAKQDDKYPGSRIRAGYYVKLLSNEEVESYLKSRLDLIEQYKERSDDQLPACTREELWASDEVFAVKKPGAKRATKLFDNKQDAQDFVNTSGLNAVIETRPPKAKRCKYCAALPFCQQGQSYKQLKLIAY